MQCRELQKQITLGHLRVLMSVLCNFGNDTLSLDLGHDM